jgi:fatty-acyl-CoA synthase
MTDQAMRQSNHLGHLVVAALRRHRDKPVMELGGSTLTGGEMAAAVSRYVQALDSLGVGPSALLSTNRSEVLLIVAAGQVLGARRTALHPLGSLDDHAYAMNDAGIGTLIVDPVFAERARGLLAKAPGLKQVLTIGPAPDLPGAVDLVAAADGFRPAPLQPAPVDPGHVVSITYTGGTTGRPKGVMGTAQSMLTMSQVMLAEWEWPDAPRFLVCTPLSHAGAAFFVPTLLKGGSLVVLPRFDPAEVLRAVEEQRITATMLVPTMLYALLDHPDSRTRDLSSLQTVYYGAAAINPVRLREAIDRFGPIFAQFYGQSEAPMAISYLPRGEHDDARLTSCGRPSAFLRTALLDEGGNPVAPGHPGEICVAGPLLAAGYWNNPEATAAAFGGGWLRTGDVAREDPDGYWHIVDRVKDMIVTGGFNVFPREVEDAIATHPAVAQVGVIGVPDPTWGEAVTAIVVLRADTAENGPASLADELKALVRDRKGPVQAPKHVIVVDRLPLTALGKPDKKALRATYADRPFT